MAEVKSRTKFTWRSLWREFRLLFGWWLIVGAYEIMPDSPDKRLIGAAAAMQKKRDDFLKEFGRPLCEVCGDTSCVGGAYHEIKGRWAPTDRRRAFVDGAKWWEFRMSKATMWRSDIDEAEMEANRRYS